MNDLAMVAIVFFVLAVVLFAVTVSVLLADLLSRRNDNKNTLPEQPPPTYPQPSGQIVNKLVPMPKKHPTQSAVLKYPTPQEIRAKNERDAIDDHMNQAVKKRDQGSYAI